MSMSLTFLIRLLSICGIIGLAGCASEMDRDDRAFFYDSWKPSSSKAAAVPERDHQEIFKEKQ
jgi:hypothetical protein